MEAKAANATIVNLFTFLIVFVLLLKNIIMGRGVGGVGVVGGCRCCRFCR